jgi:hypothetical protein
LKNQAKTQLIFGKITLKPASNMCPLGLALNSALKTWSHFAKTPFKKCFCKPSNVASHRALVDGEWIPKPAPFIITDGRPPEVKLNQILPKFRSVAMQEGSNGVTTLGNNFDDYFQKNTATE